jgi:integron integrase
MAGEATRYWLEQHRMRREAKEQPLTPREQAIFDSMASVSITRHESIHTAATYGSAVVDYARWLVHHPAVHDKSSEDKVAAYLSTIAPSCAAKTQNMKLCALVRYYRDVLKKPLGDLPAWTYAKVARRLPVCLTREEMARMLALIDGTAGLMARVTYGAGLRLMEATALRIQDVDLAQCLITVRAGKGNKDRTVPLAQSLVAPLGAHIERVRALWEADARRGAPPVMLPDGLERKYPNAGRQWNWFWMFPGRDLSRDPASGIVRRHHAHRNCLGKVVATAARKAAISKRVTVHTLRHSFATHQLQRGVNIRQLQELMGHNSIETTQIYLHCLPAEINQAGSPLDDLAGPVVVPFAPIIPTPAALICAARVS